MSRSGISYHEVARAAEQLIASGHEPTIERCRIILKTGSNSTIAGHLRVWRDKQEITQQIASKEHLPEELVGLLKGLWERVMSQAESQIATIQGTAIQTSAELNRMIEEQQKENNRLLQSEAELKQSVYALTQEKAVLEQMLSPTKTTIAILESQIVGLEQKLNEKDLRIDELHKQNQQIQTNLEYYRAAMVEQRQADNLRNEEERRRLEKDIADLKLANKTLDQEKNDLDKKFIKLQHESDSLLLQNDSNRQGYENIGIELNKTKLLLAQKGENCQHWEEKHETLSVESKTQIEKIMVLQAEIAVLNEQLSMVKSQLDETVGQNKLLANEKWILGQEKAQLAGELKQLHQAFLEKAAA
ncbi:MAG: DNA-binding protein [Gammaproteobacteria bacterium]|nr:DNA-binding protein [Gammaproteobacteria bacterium]MBY0544361.1 DNA-binding protein [Gammaproteobacteria bacterium]